MKEILYTFNLQLFAGGLVSSGANATVISGSMGGSTNTPPRPNVNDNLAPGIKEYYDKKLIKTAQANLVHHQFGQKRPIPQGEGKTVHFRRYKSLPKMLTPISEGVTPNGQELKMTEITSTVDQYGGYVILSDVLQMTAIDNHVYEATELLGNQAGLTIDTIDRNVLQKGTNSYYCPKINASTGALTPVTSRTAMDATCKLTVRALKHVVAALRGVNAPTFDGYYQGIIHPYNAFELMTDPEWEQVQNYASPENRLVGEIGKIAGVRFVESSEAAVFVGTGEGGGADGTIPVYSTLIFGKDAYGTTEIEGGGMQVIVKQLGYGDDPLNQRSSVGWKAMETAEILIPEYMINVYSTSNEFEVEESN